MSVLELLFALLLVCLMAATAFLAWNLLKQSEVNARDVAELKLRLAAGGQTQDSQAAELRERLSQTQSALEGLRSAISARHPIEEEARASLKRLESIIAGSSSRGAAGERILEEALRHLPPEMLQRNVWVGGKVVELALRLPGGKLLPMDSKWVSSPALEQLAEPGLDASRRAQLTATVEREVERRVKEVSQYIDAATTTPFALAVIPDAAYDVCRSAIVTAHRRHVMVVGYAMALPYLLTLYQLHLQFARTVDMEKLQTALIDIERHVDVLDGILENKVQRSLTVLQNAYTEGRQATAKIRASAQSAQISDLAAGRAQGVFPGEVVSTDSPGAEEDLSTETLRLALLDSVQ
ncbi:MAG TPA: DNA recombination protein RmuC [Candidatus Dormibacteraeota bacterium]|nr:DNA recombination protein RmuC [Candidatus Dormibacteraeota bacterium]